MSTPYIGEIRMFAGNFAPAGWAFCDGSMQNIAENDTLFTLIGTTYGGDGESTFALPNLASRVPISAGRGKDGLTYSTGDIKGDETITLSVAQLPVHNHQVIASGTAASTRDPVPGNAPTTTAGDVYNITLDAIPLNAQSILPTGGSQPHENMQPYFVINFIIALFGIYPSPS